MTRSDSSILLQYGQAGLSLATRGLNATILRPQPMPGLADERAAFRQAVQNPYGTPPLRTLVRTGETVAIAIPDITRALPTRRLLPWVLDELSHIPRGDIRIVVGTGTHRTNTRAELCSMVGPTVVDTIPVICHNARDRSTMTRVGRSRYGYDVWFNTEYVRADRRILMGFIEPHFMAGFSGGYKAVFPGLADMDAILQYHGYDNIAHPRSTWGLLANNPTQGHVRAGGSLVPVDFLINVTLNDEHAITRFFCGDVIQAHEVGCAYSRACAMAYVEKPFPIVVTTNSGYPLDLNLYQSVKGMCAAAAITAKGGLIITAARCNNGFPDHGAFKDQLIRFRSPAEGRRAIRHPEFSEPDQWQTQKLFQILKTCRIQLYSELSPHDVRRVHLDPIACVREAIDAELRRIGDPEAPVAIMPEGPLTIPYLA